MMAVVRFKKHNNLVKLSPQMFMRRFTSEERIALRQLAKQDTDEGFAITDALDLLSKATYVDLDDEQTIGSIAFMRSIGILSDSRAEEILSKNIAQNELYEG